MDYFIFQEQDGKKVQIYLVRHKDEKTAREYASLHGAEFVRRLSGPGMPAMPFCELILTIYTD